MNSFDFMRSPQGDTIIEYPLFHETADRIQIIFNENLYGMLILNRATNFWCGYTLLSQDEAEAEKIDYWRMTLGASYLAPASEPITWMLPNKSRRLIVPTQLLSTPGGDFWLGFHTEFTGPASEQVSAINEVTRFAYRANALMRSYANPTV